MLGAPLSDARELTCFTVSRELSEKKTLSQETYAAALQTMGENDLIALVAGVGSFVMTCLTANAFDVDPPADNPTPLKAICPDPDQQPRGTGLPLRVVRALPEEPRATSDPRADRAAAPVESETVRWVYPSNEANEAAPRRGFS